MHLDTQFLDWDQILGKAIPKDTRTETETILYFHDCVNIFEA